MLVLVLSATACGSGREANDPLPDGACPETTGDTAPEPDLPEADTPGTTGANYTVHEWGVISSQRLQAAPTHYISNEDKPILYFYADSAIDVDASVTINGGTGRETWPEVELGSTMTWNGIHVRDSPCQEPTPFPGFGEGQCPYPGEEPCEAVYLANYVVDDASCITFGEVESPILFYAGMLDEPYLPVTGSFDLLTVEPAAVSVTVKPEASFAGKLFVVYRDITGQSIDFGPIETTKAKFAYAVVDVPADIPEEGLSVELAPEQVVDDPDLPGFGPPPGYADLVGQLTELLIEQGLTEKETDAFLTAWQHIFFGSSATGGQPHVPVGPSVTIVGVHKQSDYEALMPLVLTPPPSKLVRVLVSYTNL